MNVNLINMSIKILCINILVPIINKKILSIKIKWQDFIFTVSYSIFVTGIYVFLSRKIDNLLNIIFMYIFQLIGLMLLLKDKKENLMVTNIITNAIIYISFCISVFVEIPVMIALQIKNKIINGILVDLIDVVIIYYFFKIRRFRKGFVFTRNNEYASIIMINISAIIILAYYLYGNYYENMTKQLFVCFSVLSVIMIIMIQKTLTLYYKQKLLAKNIEDYKSEIALKDAQIKSLSDEKYKISKLNHEFYNRQRALIHKVEEITSMNTEIADELDFSKQINDLTKEYTDKA